MADDYFHDDDPPSNFDLAAKFPEMQPIQRVPPMGHVFGTGAMMMGHRDYDSETGTYVKTHCFTLLFVPVVALSAYRVMDAPSDGWYFFGKVPLSDFSRNWNRLFALLLVVGGVLGGWYVYTNTDDYRTGQQLARADELQRQGNGAEAAALLRDVLLSSSPKAGVARERFDALVAQPPGDLTDTAGVYQVAVELQRIDKHTIKDLFFQATKLAREHETSDPLGALAVLDAVVPLAGNPGEHLDPRRRILDRLVDQSPDDVDLCSRLARVCADQGDFKRCLAVLARHEDKLGEREGAAILGHVYATQGKLDKARKLLTAYVDACLPVLRGAEYEFRSVRDAAETRILTTLRENKAADFDFPKYNAATRAEKEQMIGEYLSKKLKDDVALRQALERLARQQAVVPAALDLGMVLLQQAQSAADPDARQRELKKAEETFVSVGTFAANSDQYRLSLGQVYYWLGKAKEGKKLFDEYLAKHNHSSDTVQIVSNLLREVGATSEARTLIEQAYEKETNPTSKELLAGTRAVMYLDLEDKILWLGRSNAKLPLVKSLLAEAQGTKAARDRRDADAERHYKEALAVYATQPETSATLNNSALIHFSLYRLTQDVGQFQRGVEKLERAVALKPGDTLLMGNLADTLLQGVARDLLGDSMDWKVLKRSPSLDLLAYLHGDGAGQDRLTERLRGNVWLVKARTYYDKLLVLAPRRMESYVALEWLYDQLDDVEALRKLAIRLKEADLDMEGYKRQALESITGKKADKDRDDLVKSLQRYEEVLVEARKVGGRTFAAAAGQLAAGRMAAALYDLPVDADGIVKLVQEADAVATSSGTRGMLIEAYLFRAHLALTKQDEEYAALAKKTRRTLGTQLVTWAVGNPGRLRELALANADVQLAIKGRVALVQAYPDSTSAATWAFLRAAHPDVAAKLGERLKAGQQEAIRRELDRTLAPLSHAMMLEAYWYLILQGKADEAAAWLREQQKKGVPLPIS